MSLTLTLTLSPLSPLTLVCLAGPDEALARVREDRVRVGRGRGLSHLAHADRHGQDDHAGRGPAGLLHSHGQDEEVGPEHALPRRHWRLRRYALPTSFTVVATLIDTTSVFLSFCVFLTHRIKGLHNSSKDHHKDTKYMPPQRLYLCCGFIQAVSDHVGSPPLDDDR